MTDYNSMKVPELKKLLQSRSLGVTGNKADLVARLVDADKQNAPADAAPVAAAPAAAPANDNEGLIDWSDDDEPAASKSAAAPKAADPAPAPAAAPVTEAPKPAGPATADAPAAVTEPAAAEKTDEAAPAETKAEDEAPKEDFALHLGASDAAEEARKRAERAKRFGITAEAGDEEAKKKAERASRFGGVETGDLSKSLDAALPEKERRAKRGREGEQGGRDNKRQTVGGGDRDRGGRRDRNQNQNRGRGQGQGQGQGGRQPRGGNGPKKQPAALDPADKAKMEARAKRFATSS